MTICIAELCEEKKKIVVAADRMVTVGTFIEFEHDVIKFVELSNNCVIMTAGSATIQNDIIECAKVEIDQSSKPIFNQIVEKVKGEYMNFRRNRAEELHLKPKGLNFTTFYQNQSVLQPELVYRIVDLIDKTNLGVEFITCGFDDKGGHIQYITDPGISESFDSVGFCAIGTGNVNAVSVFTAYNYAPSFSLSKSLYLVYSAKKEAERSPGVGNETDIAIISEEGIRYLNSDEEKELEKIYLDSKRIEEKEYKVVETNIINKWGVKDDTGKEDSEEHGEKENSFGYH